MEIHSHTFPQSNDVFNFEPKIDIYIESGSYILKTAKSYDELLESCILRHEVFYQEFQGVEEAGVDMDQFDHHFDHLIIIHRETNKIIGTYRINSSEFSNMSYTAQEFDLAEVFKLKGPHIELGRACIQKDHRKGASVIFLLWRGIIEYMTVADANVLYGCSSIKINNPAEAALVYKYLQEQGSVMDEKFSSPTKEFSMPEFENRLACLKDGLGHEQSEVAGKLIPSLLKSYIKFGAKIASEPAFDVEFDCIDVLTVLKKEDIADSITRRFQVVQ